MRRLMWWLTAAMATGLVTLGPASPSPAAEGAQVLMVDNEPDLTRWHFDPAEVTVPAGATVTWVNKGKQEHTVTADDKSFDSGMKRTGASFQRAFPKPGRYTYYCAPHPWMKGAVRVVAAAAGRTASEAGAVPGTSTSVTARPSTTTTIPATFVPPATAGQNAGSPAPPASAPPAETASPAGTPEEETAGDEAAAVARRGDDGSGDGLAGTLALVLIPTAAGLALGAKLRQRSSSAEA